MKVYINGRFLMQPVTGVQRFARELVLALDERMGLGESKIQFVLVAPRKFNGPTPVRHMQFIREGVLSGHMWEQLSLPQVVGDSLLVNLCNTAPLRISNQIVVVHDAAVMAYPDAYSWKFRAWYGAIIPRIIRKSRKVLTISEFSRREIHQRYGVSDVEIGLIGEGHEHVLRSQPNRSILDRHGLRKGEFVLCVSSLQPTKNFGVVLEAARQLNGRGFTFAVAGGTNPKIFQDAVVLNDDVKWLGYVSDSELRALYEDAFCFVFPSLYEGFGLPPLEAMACGCPVVSSNAASIPEVCGGASLSFPPDSASALAEKLVMLSTNPNVRQRLISEGINNSKRHSWRYAADELLITISTLDDSRLDEHLLKV